MTLTQPKRGLTAPIAALGFAASSARTIVHCAMAAAILLIPCSSSSAQSIRAVRENGRVVFVNDGPAKALPKAEPENAPAKLVYWSATKKRWMPVSSPSPNALRAARQAAAEVASYVEAQPVTATARRSFRSPFASRLAGTAQPETPKLMPAVEVTNPNYKDIARGHLVTSADMDRVIEESARKHGVDANLVRAVVKVESNFNPRAVSRAGAMGLMQLMPQTARSLNVTNPFDPEQNVDAGVRHLKGLLQNYNGDVQLSLAAYNAGQGAVARNGNRIPPYAETKDYVRRITGLYGGGLQSVLSLTPSAPVRMRRDERGVLTISNTD